MMGRELAPCHCLLCSFCLTVTLIIEVLRDSLFRSLPADSQLAVLAFLGMAQGTWVEREDMQMSVEALGPPLAQTIEY